MSKRKKSVSSLHPNVTRSGLSRSGSPVTRTGLSRSSSPVFTGMTRSHSATPYSNAAEIRKTQKKISNDDFSLHEAAYHNDREAMLKLMEFVKSGKLSIVYPDIEWGMRTPLHIAAEQGSDVRFTLS